MNKKTVLEAVKKYGGQRGASKALKISRWRISRIVGLTEKYQGIVKPVPVVKDDPTSLPSKVVRRRNLISEDALLISTDAETRITQSLRDEAKRLGPGQYMKDLDMRKECHSSDMMLWREIRQQEEFWPYVMMVGRTSDPMIYWGNPVSVKALIGRGKAKKPIWSN